MEKRGFGSFSFRHGLFARRAQIGVEYIIIVGVVIGLAIPGFYFLRNYAVESQQHITSNRVEKVASILRESAKEVYYLGTNTKNEVTFNLPDGIERIGIWQAGGEYYLVFGIYGSDTALMFKSDIPLACYENGAPCQLGDIADITGGSVFEAQTASGGPKTFSLTTVATDPIEVRIADVSE